MSKDERVENHKVLLFVQLKPVVHVFQLSKNGPVTNQARMIHSLPLTAGPYLAKNLMVCGKGKYSLLRSSLTVEITFAARMQPSLSLEFFCHLFQRYIVL